ncbi:DUF4054 domain-containing protein [Collimonas pratensis]|uniref:DUF4054 domain-containing protein n=1 Tax=Collimonas pratensis TaxID=279113 RepID=UPI00143D0D38|nr:DUF4054 domain-containing protein [Collimonas pratensis]NKI68956.1 DUF4054 domain-containing protein [Collimonas pratensis]
MSCVIGGVVAFDYTAWSVRYPELASSVAQPLAQQYFNEAQLYCDNTPCSPIRDASVGGQRSMLLNMLTAHIAALNAPIGGQPSSSLVGRISNATEGSVSVATQMDLPAGSPQWFAQSKYGIAFWQATSQYRTMHYVPGPVPVINPYGRFGRR